MTPEKIVEKFDESVPRLLQRDMVRSVLVCYQEADRFVRRRYQPTEALALRGHIRNADLEVDLRNVAAKYVDAEATPEPNRIRSAYHSTVTIGAVKMTQSRVPQPNCMVRPSIFREEYAAESAQMLLFDESVKKRRKVVEIDETDYLYAVLIHGYSKQDKAKPYFIRFAFPSADCSDWITQIDLMKRFPDTVTEFYAPLKTAEMEQRRVRLRKGIKRGGKEKQA